MNRFPSHDQLRVLLLFPFPFPILELIRSALSLDGSLSSPDSY